MTTNRERLIALANEAFNTKNDPNQLDVTLEIIGKLQLLHPSTVSERSDENGPIAWVLVIPTTQPLMHRFVAGEINENDIFQNTPPGTVFDTIYLCSALVLEEYRRKGVALHMTVQAIEEIRKMYPIQSLFVWPFSTEGIKAAKKVALTVSLPLYCRE